MVTAGIFALQGDVSEHVKIVESLGYPVRLIRNPEDLEQVTHAIVPGGESTTFGKLAHLNGLDAMLISKAKEGMRIFGTCAGMIMLSKGIVRYENQPTWRLMDIAVKRNAYGRQLQSTITDIEVKGIGTMNVAFIRAPIIATAGKDVDILAYDWNSNIILARQGNILAGAFHPEITGDPRLHEMFMNM